MARLRFSDKTCQKCQPETVSGKRERMEICQTRAMTGGGGEGGGRGGEERLALGGDMATEMAQCDWFLGAYLCAGRGEGVGNGTSRTKFGQ